MTSEATMPNPADLLGKATNHVKEVVAGVQQSQLSDPTACSEWDVRGLINHLIGGLEFAAGTMAGTRPTSSSLPPIVLTLANTTPQICPKPIETKLTGFWNLPANPARWKRLRPRPSEICP